MAMSVSVARHGAAVAFSSEKAAQLASTRNGFCAPSLALAPKKSSTVYRARSLVVSASAAADRVPDMNKRNIMNLLLLGALSAPAVGVLGPYLYFFVPPSSGGSGGGLVAKDALGSDITEKAWLKEHKSGDRSLVQGLKGDPTYLVVENDGTLGTYAINAVCTHLGCVVPFNAAENKFICPCHGSQYNNQGKVVRGPAPLSLALAHADVNIDDNKIILSNWPETDFRTGEAPWWT